MEKPVLPVRRFLSSPEPVLLLLLGAAAFCPPFFVGREGFLLFDHSLVVDAGWRILNGQVPHVDFVLPSGPGCFVLQALFFLLCGANLYAPLVHAAAFNVLAAWIVYRLVRRETGPLLSAAAGLAAGAWFYFPFSFPWYDTSAFFFVLLAEGVWRRYLRPHPGGPGGGGAALAAGLVAGCAFLCKQNVGLLAVGLYFVLLLLPPSGGRARRVFFFLLGCILLPGAYLLFNTFLGGGADTLEGLFERPLLMGRGRRLLSPRTWERAFRFAPLWFLAASVLVEAAWALGRRPRLERFRACGDTAGLSMLCLLSAVTGTAPKYLFLPFAGLTTAFFMARVLSRGTEGARGRRILRVLLPGAALLALAAWGGAVGFSRSARAYALRRCGFQTDYALRTPALRPFRMDAVLGPALDEVIAELKKRGAAEDGVYVFPNATVIYMALGYVSPQPFVWLHGGQSFFPRRLGDEARLVEALRRSAPAWVVLWDGYQFDFDRAVLIRFLPDLARFLAEGYVLERQTPQYRLLHRKGKGKG